MKRLLLAIAASLVTMSVAVAADMPVRKAPALTTDAAPIWSGLYIGGHAGWATLDSDPTMGQDLNGLVYGGHVGFQVQKGWLVAGIETGLTNYSEVKVNGFGCDCIVADLLGKVGITVTPNLLAYAVGGGFWHNASVGNLPQFGWTIGGGLDWLPFNDHFVIGARYQYRNLDVPNQQFTVFAHEFKIHVDYKL